MKIGLMASGSGRALDAALSLTKTIHPNACFIGFSDRDCGAFEVLQKHCTISSQYASTCKKEISERAYTLFRANSCDCIILSYSRLVTESLYDNFSCYNIHPSLLPEYKGLGAVEAAFNENARQLGVTIHKVDNSIDGGPIACQVKTDPVKKNIKYWQSLSYLMKALLLTSFLDQTLANGANRQLHTISCAPYLPENMQLKGITTSARVQNVFLQVVKGSNALSLFLVI